MTHYHAVLKQQLQAAIADLETLLWLTPLLSQQLNAFRAALAAIVAGEAPANQEETNA